MVRVAVWLVVMTIGRLFGGRLILSMGILFVLIRSIWLLGFLSVVIGACCRILTNRFRG